MSSRSVTLEYGRLLTKISPKVIHSEKENEEYTRACTSSTSAAAN